MITTNFDDESCVRAHHPPARLEAAVGRSLSEAASARVDARVEAFS